MTVLGRLGSLFDSAAPVTARLGLAPSVQVGLRTPFDDGTSHLHHVTVQDLFGAGAGDRLPLTRAEAMAIPAVRRARNVLCGTLARVPLRVHGPDGAPRTDVTWVSQPDPAVTRSRQVADTLDDLLFYDVSYAVVIARGWDKRPAAIRRVEVHRVTTPERVGGDYRIDDRPFPYADVIRVDGIGGGGILADGARTLRIAGRLEAAAARVSDNPVPALNLQQTDGPTLTGDERRALVSGWVEARKAGHGVGFTSKGIRADVLGAPAEHLLIGARQASGTDVARVLGVPADAIDAPSGSGMTYNNAQARNQALIDYGLANLAAPLEDRWSGNDLVPAGSRVLFDLDVLTRPTFADRMAGYADARTAEVYTVDELRALEAGQPLTRG